MSHSFTVRAVDANNAPGTAAYTIAIAVAPPVVGPVSASIPANAGPTPITLALTGGAATSVAVATAPTRGTAAASGTTITYRPNTGYSGTDTFTYTATNASGASAPATVTITVSPPVLAFSPAAGALPNGTTGQAYTATIVATNGTGPYSYAISAGALPTGLTLSATGGILGTPTAPGSASFTVRATDTNGAPGTAAYTLTIRGSVPTAADKSATVLSGSSASIELSIGASGGPFTAATIVGAPPASQGTATVAGMNGAFRVVFTAASAAVGTTVIRYTLSNQWGTSAPATITVTIDPRPDPSRDQEVIGLLNAQAQAAKRFATSQISNFNERMEALHDERERQSTSFNMQVSTGPEAPQDPRMAYPREMKMNDPAGRSMMGMPTKAPPGKTPPPSGKGSDLAFWTGGFVNFGTARSGNSDLSHVLVGVSGGMDYRFSRNFVTGLGIGYGRDRTDIGRNGTESRAQAFSGALYGSYHMNGYFLDGLVGYSQLDFDSRRFVTNTAGFATGQRDGSQVFGSLTAGYEYKAARLLVSPYARIQAARTRLDAFTETGADIFNLTYGEQPFSMLAGVAGLRGEYAMPMSWGVLTTRGRLEYTHDFSGSSLATMGYADLGATLPYSLAVAETTRNYLTVGMGLGAKLENGVTLGFDYRTSFGFDGNAQNHSFLARAGLKF